MADTSTHTSVMPKGVMERLGRFGYAVNGTRLESVSAGIERILTRVSALPGVSNDPVTKAAITAILNEELNGNGNPDSSGSPQVSPRGEERGNRGNQRTREVNNLPGI